MALQIKDLVYALTRLGLSEYESKVYITLLQLGVCGVKELTVNSKVPRTKIYPTLKSLEKKELVTILPGKPVRAKALMPTKVLTEPLKDLEENLQLLKNAIQELQKIYENFSNKEKFEEQKYWIIRGTSETIKRIEELLNLASREVLFILNQEMFEIIINKLSNALNSITKQKISIKIITNANYNPVILEKISDFIEVKYLPFKLDGGIIIIDESEILTLKYDYLDRRIKALMAEHFSKSDICIFLKNLIIQLYKNGVDFSSLAPFLSIPDIKSSFVDARQNIFLPIFFYSFIESMSTQMGRDAINFFIELGRNMISSLYSFTISTNFQESLNLLSSFYLIDEGIEVKFTWDGHSNILICEFTGNFPEQYKMAHEHGFPIPPSIWGFYLLGLISLFGYTPSCEESVFESNHWLIKYRLIEKAKSKGKIAKAIN
ncbi:MAG: helix-turn-helix domain-containing protein [Candidatus Methanomethylicaceae archaeon]|nr:helix-turn-helix domain-containing protein [Candidatus Verstraetearchaeota archaeon]